MNITHQFRNPLTVILGMTGELKNNPDEAIKLIEHNSKQILLLINQMLDLSKLESGKMKLNPVLRDIISYLRYLTESYQSFAASKKIQLMFFTSLEELIMDHDEEKLQQIITNLLSNAVKFTPENGKIIMDVNVRKQGVKEELIIKIKDNGIGIPSSELPHIFERFYRVDHSSETGGIGTGIGLALIKELIQLMEGKILVRSELKKGTEFTVILPINRVAGSNLAPTLISEERLLKPTEAKNIKKVKNKILEKPGTEKNEAKPLLLIIEDNPDVAAYIQTCLNGYRIEKATSGQTGIDKAIELVPEIIISDVMMPEKNGFEVCQTLKTNLLTSHIPIILLTARADIDSRLKGLGEGADAYLSKPFVKEELLIRVKKLLELRLKLQERFAEKSYFSRSVHNSASNKSQSSESTLNELFLKKIYDLVQENLQDADFGYSQLANKMFLSESQLYRKIKALTGRSTAIHIRSIRLHKAKELLLNCELTIAEVAFETGFNDPSYFSRCFNEEFKTSPSNFRK
jgi:DNA-binding response OmpR family regulator